MNNSKQSMGLDPQFTDYLADQPRLSYAKPEYSKLRKLVINNLETVLGRHKLEKAYWRLKEQPFDINTFFGRAILTSGLEVNHLGNHPRDVEVDGPLILLANHPFGIVDGMVFCDIAAQLRGDLRILINSALCQDADLAPYFLPIDFEPTKQAIKTNIRSKQLALEALHSGVPVLIFPSGMVSTAERFGFGKVQDAPWTTFAAKLVKQSQATVLPVFFHGKNSRKFHVASHIAEALRMGLLMHEALNKFGGKVDVAIGDAIPWQELSEFDSRQQLTEALYQRVQALSMLKGVQTRKRPGS